MGARAVTFTARRSSKRYLAELKAEAPGLYWRPQTRGDCENGPRPCPFVGCRHHLYLDSTRRGSMKTNFPDVDPADMEHTCSLDPALRDMLDGDTDVQAEEERPPDWRGRAQAPQHPGLVPWADPLPPGEVPPMPEPVDVPAARRNVRTRSVVPGCRSAGTAWPAAGSSCPGLVSAAAMGALTLLRRRQSKGRARRRLCRRSRHVQRLALDRWTCCWRQVSTCRRSAWAARCCST